MKTGTGGLKDGDGIVIVVCNSQSEGDDVLRLYRAVDQDVARFDFAYDLDAALFITEVYGAGTQWAVAADTPPWFNDELRLRFTRAFGPQMHLSQAIGAYTDEYAIDPKRLRTPPL